MSLHLLKILLYPARTAHPFGGMPPGYQSGSKESRHAMTKVSPSVVLSDFKLVGAAAGTITPPSGKPAARDWTQIRRNDKIAHACEKFVLTSTFLPSHARLHALLLISSLPRSEGVVPLPNGILIIGICCIESGYQPGSSVYRSPGHFWLQGAQAGLWNFFKRQ